MSCQHLHSNRLATAVAVALLWSGALPAVAQTAPAAGSAGEQAQNEPKTLDTLVVTAQKREEIMQNVPITVTALPQQLLQDNNVRDIKDLQTLVPGADGYLDPERGHHHRAPARHRDGGRQHWSGILGRDRDR